MIPSTVACLDSLLGICFGALRHLVVASRGARQNGLPFTISCRRRVGAQLHRALAPVVRIANAPAKFFHMATRARSALNHRISPPPMFVCLDAFQSPRILLSATAEAGR